LLNDKLKDSNGFAVAVEGVVVAWGTELFDPIGAVVGFNENAIGPFGTV